MSYARNKAASRKPIIGVTKTDQSGARDTDINVIVDRMKQTGMFPAGAKQPFYADLSIIPDNLRDMMEMSKNIEEHRNQLPEALKGMSAAELLTADPQKIANLMTEHERYTARVAKLPEHLKSLSRAHVLGLTDEQLTNIITPPQPAAPQSTQK